MGAKIKADRSRERDRAEEAKFAAANQPGGGETANAVRVTLVFPGDNELRNRESSGGSVGYQHSSIRVRLDAEEVGSGSGADGFKLEFTTTPGLHDLTFLWSVDRERWTSSNQLISSREMHYRTDF